MLARDHGYGINQSGFQCLIFSKSRFTSTEQPSAVRWLQSACVAALAGAVRAGTLENNSAIVEVALCPIHYNTARPHSALGNRTPAEFASAHVLIAPSPTTPHDRYE